MNSSTKKIGNKTWKGFANVSEFIYELEEVVKSSTLLSLSTKKNTGYSNGSYLDLRTKNEHKKSNTSFTTWKIISHIDI